jgi:hypothetical protein
MQQSRCMDGCGRACVLSLCVASSCRRVHPPRVRLKQTPDTRESEWPTLTTRTTKTLTPLPAQQCQQSSVVALTFHSSVCCRPEAKGFMPAQRGHLSMHWRNIEHLPDEVRSVHSR